MLRPHAGKRGAAANRGIGRFTRKQPVDSVGPRMHATKIEAARTASIADLQSWAAGFIAKSTSGSTPVLSHHAASASTSL